MNTITSELETHFKNAIIAAFGPDYADTDPLIRMAQDNRFGDYQSNLAMPLSKKVSDKPRNVAEKIIANLDIADICDTPEIAGPGFINLRIKADWLARRLEHNLPDTRIGIEPVAEPQIVVVDYCGPNIAKQMHVGHLRSTIIGDVIARVLEFLGHNVIRQNHVGDWGTQFGMLIAYLFETFGTEAVETGNLHIADIEAFYKQANEKFKSDEQFADRARKQVVELQAGDEQALLAWKVFRSESLKHCQEIYDELGVKLTTADVRGESNYNALLPAVVDDLIHKHKLAVEDHGAVCVFLDEFKGKDGSPLPVIIRKTDGGFLYATTDLAALRFRVSELDAERVIYVTDARQVLHFQQIFATAHKAGWDLSPKTQQPIKLDHVTFGSVLGEDGKPLKTRSGENVKLKDLINEAIARAQKVVDDKNPDLPADQKTRIAEAVGIGAVKYADLAQNRTSDYIFSYEKMLAMEGNTAPYLMYAYARIKSIQRKSNINSSDLPADAKIVLGHTAEVTLAKKILQFADIILDVSANLKPNIITAYLYELSQTFSGFYENCPVLKAEDETTRMSRLLLCDLTARTLKQGLDLLGIETLEQM
jgi:arginyl-tRNA synthetase